MKMKIIIFATILLISNVFAEGIIPNKSEEIVGIQEKVIISFLERMQKAIKEEDKQVISDLVLFPFKKYQKGKVIRTYSKKEFLKHYDSIVGATIKEAILKQKPEELFINSKGVMIEQGEVWYGPWRNETHSQR